MSTFTNSDPINLVVMAVMLGGLAAALFARTAWTRTGGWVMVAAAAIAAAHLVAQGEAAVAVGSFIVMGFAAALLVASDALERRTEAGS